MGEGDLGHGGGDQTGVFLAAFVERQVGPARVLVRLGPGRVAVPDEVQL